MLPVTHFHLLFSIVNDTVTPFGCLVEYPQGVSLMYSSLTPQFGVTKTPMFCNAAARPETDAREIIELERILQTEKLGHRYKKLNHLV